MHAHAPPAGKGRRLPVNAGLPKLEMKLRGHPALELLADCRVKGWADDSAETVDAFESVELYSFKRGVRLGDQLAWAISFDPKDALTKRCQLTGTYSHNKPTDDGKLQLTKAVIKRLGLLDYTPKTVAINRTVKKRVGGVAGGEACASWDDVFAEGAAPVYVVVKGGVRILLTSYKPVPVALDDGMLDGLRQLDGHQQLDELVQVVAADHVPGALAAMAAAMATFGGGGEAPEAEQYEL